MIVDHCRKGHKLPALIKHWRKETKKWQRDWTNVQPPARGCSCRDSKSLAFRTLHWFHAGIGCRHEDRSACIVSGRSACVCSSATVQSLRDRVDKSCVAWRFLCWSATRDGLNLSHCTVFCYMMLLAWFVLGSFCVSSSVRSVLVL